MLDGADRLRRRTAVICHELARYNIDVAALSETRLSGEGSLCEEGEGYTIYWRGYPDGVPRIHGVGIALRNSIAANLTESPVYVSERLMTLRIPLVRGEYVTIISGYAPTLSSDEEDKDQFYESLNESIRRVPNSDKLILMGDFNARVGKDAGIWPEVIERHGVGRMNSNGLRLLTLCSELDLSITNTFFRLKNKHKTSWMHPRSRHWHLIDFIIVRRRDISCVTRTRAMRGAECATDHRLIISDICWKIRPKSRRQQSKTKKLNVNSLHDPCKRADFQEKIREGLQSTLSPVDDLVPASVEESWSAFARAVHGAAISTIGTQKRRHRDWFDENNTEIRLLINKKNEAHNATLRNPSSVILEERFKTLRAEVQRELRRIENSWWVELANEIQGYADGNDMHNFYDGIKRAYGPLSKSITPVRSEDGTNLIKDNDGILERWAEHFSAVLNGGSPADLTILTEIPQSPVKTELDDTPTLEEVQRCIETLRNNKSPGVDGIPAEVLKYGGTELIEALYRIIRECWETEAVPEDWKLSRIISVYKNKGDRSICDNSRGISLLSVAGKVLAKIMLHRLVENVSEDILPETHVWVQARPIYD